MAKRKKPRTSPAAVAADMSRLERDKSIWERRKAGASIREIAAEFSLSGGRVHAILTRDEEKIESSKQELVLETFVSQVEHLETLVGVAMTRATSADGGAADVQAAARAIQVQAEVVGTKAATKAELTGANGGPLQAQVAAVVVHKFDLSTLSMVQLQALEAIALANVAGEPTDDA